MKQNSVSKQVVYIKCRAAWFSECAAVSEVLYRLKCGETETSDWSAQRSIQIV